MRKFCIIQVALVCMTIGSIGIWAQVSSEAIHSQGEELQVVEGGEKPTYTLVDCINIALRKNPNVLAVAKKIEEAEGQRIEARAGFLPSLTSSATALYREKDYATHNGDNPDLTKEDWNINVRVIQNIYSGGRVGSKFEISKLGKEQRHLEYRATVDQMIMDVRIAFYEVLQSRAEIEVRKQAIEMLQQELKDQKSRYEAGTVPRLNVLRAEVNLANEMPFLIEAENNHKNSMLKLSELMAISYSIEERDVPFFVKGNLDYKKADFSLDDCLVKAETTRPELKDRELNIKIKEKQITVDRSNILPRLDLFAGYDLLNESSRSSSHDSVGGYVAGISGTWHIFDGLETHGKLKATRARLAASYLERDAQRNSIFSEVRSAFLKLQQAEATVASQTENAMLARESFLLSKASFEAGLSSQLDIMQSRVDLTKAQTNELKAKFNHKVALAKLQRAISSEFRIVDDNSSSDLTQEHFTEPLPPLTRKQESEEVSDEASSASQSLFRKPQALPPRENIHESSRDPSVMPKNPSPKPRHLSYRFPEPSVRHENTGSMVSAPQIILNPSLAMLREEE